MKHAAALLAAAVAVALGAVAVPGAAAHAQQVPSVSIWADDGHDVFYPGDYANLRFRVAEDAHVAVLHLDPEGNIDLVFPRSPWDDEFVLGRRVHSLAGLSAGRFRLGRTPGIGYFYIIASPYPLDFRYFRGAVDRYGEPFGVGRVVRGDPFWMLEQLTHLLVPDWRYSPYWVDVYSYHLGGRHRYPTFACYDRFSRVGSWSRYAYYPSCDRLQRLLVAHPYYYDTRRYRGDRGFYLRELADLAPRHEFKESAGRAAPPVRRFDDPSGPDRPDPRARGAAPAPAVGQPREQARPADRPTTPTRQRPTLERRGRDEGRTQPAQAPPRRQPEAQPRQDPPRQRDEGRQQSAPPPRRESVRPAPSETRQRTP